MSSIVGHALISSAIFARKHKIDSGSAVFVYLFFIGLGISSDADYLVYWLFGYEIEPRITHSILFCFIIGLIASCIKRFVLKNAFISVNHELFYLASFSHLVLDLLVGVHPMPLFWPIDAHLIKLPFGILPSAGHIDIKNIYLWRNIAIEIGILAPMALLIASNIRSRVFKNSITINNVLWLVFVVSAYIGINLKR